jgi:hypothetical protein
MLQINWSSHAANKLELSCCKQNWHKINLSSRAQHCDWIHNRNAESRDLLSLLPTRSRKFVANGLYSVANPRFDFGETCEYAEY